MKWMRRKQSFPHYSTSHSIWSASRDCPMCKMHFVSPVFCFFGVLIIWHTRICSAHTLTVMYVRPSAIYNRGFFLIYTVHWSVFLPFQWEELKDVFSWLALGPRTAALHVFLTQKKTKVQPHPLADYSVWVRCWNISHVALTFLYFISFFMTESPSSAAIRGHRSEHSVLSGGTE